MPGQRRLPFLSEFIKFCFERIPSDPTVHTGNAKHVENCIDLRALVVPREEGSAKLEHFPDDATYGPNI